ncbi:MAG: peptidoglycan DD-metalloendopeptidase family protein [Oscillospiraceae bacterium]|jgi:murein DD-endopeptidase MepM/ murein hydrolase activator NlpD|nr:peptidoglycan DD-metalloendopeptidase family protein [Oscillospiraceae bacterium]
MTEMDETRPRRRREPDKGFEVLKAQLVICAAALLFALILKFIGGDVYAATKEKYATMFDDTTTVDEVLQTVTHAFDMSSRPEDGSGSGAESETPAESEISQPEETGSEAPTESAASAGSGDQVGGEDEGAAFTEYGDAVNGIVQTGASINTMKMPVIGRISDYFGYRTHPITGEFKLHRGLDIAAPSGDSIKAAYDGVTEKRGEQDDYGLYIMLDHGGGLETLYAHCSRLIAPVGSAVKKGQVIALVGNTGNSTGPHCHFEVRVNNVRINPLWLIADTTA